MNVPVQKNEGTTAKKKGFWRRMQAGVLLFAALWLLVGGVVAPRPVWAIEDGDVGLDLGGVATNMWGLAKELAEWAKKHEALWMIIKWITDIFNLLRELTGALEETWKASTKMQLFAQEQKMRVEATAAEAYMHARLNDAVMGEKLKHVGANALPPASEQFLCNLIMTRQVVPVMTEFARILSYAVGRGFNELYRCATCDGNGPQYTADALTLKCPKDKNFPKTGTLRSGDPEACREPGNGSDTGYADKDLSADTLSLDKVFTVPPIKDIEAEVDGKKKTVKEFVPDEGNEAQRQWIAARRFCTTVAGPRPTPPQGKNMDTPAGKTSYMRFAGCLAKQNDFLEACRDRLARLTRPNCDEADWKVFCEASTAACAAAKEAQINLPADIQCAEGLSLQQAEFVSNELCGSNRRIQAAGHAGANDAQRQRVLAMCTMMKEAWEKRMARDDRNFLASVLRLQSMSECWE